MPFLCLNGYNKVYAVLKQTPLKAEQCLCIILLLYSALFLEGLWRFLTLFVIIYVVAGEWKGKEYDKAVFSNLPNKKNILINKCFLPINNV